METSGQYFKVGETFFDSDLEIKAKCVNHNHGSYNPCEGCIYEYKNTFTSEERSCTDKNTPLCLNTKREDNTDVIFIRFEDDDSLRIKEVERL